MALPWLIGGAVAAVATAVLLDDDDDSNSNNNKKKRRKAKRKRKKKEKQERRKAKLKRKKREKKEKKQRIAHNFRDYLDSEGNSIQIEFSNVLNFSYTPRKHNKIKSFINSDLNGVQQQLFNAEVGLSKTKFSDCHVSDKFINAVTRYEQLYDVEVTPSPQIVKAFQSHKELYNEIKNLNKLMNKLESV